MSAEVRSLTGGGHPDDATLRTWLDTGGPRPIDEHVGACDVCAERLEALTELGDAPLAAATEPPADLAVRTTVRVRDRLAAQESVSVLVEMLSLPFRTASVLLAGGEGGSRITGEGRPSDETAGDDGE